jgi:uncharacterized protein (TIGR02145 family)
VCLLAVTTITVFHHVARADDGTITVNLKVTGKIISGQFSPSDANTCVSLNGAEADTSTTSTNNYGYTLSAFSTGTDNEFTIGASYYDGSATHGGLSVGSSSDKPTALYSSTLAANKQPISYSFSICGVSSTASGTYDAAVHFILHENKPEVADGASFQDVTSDPKKQCSALPVFTGTNTDALVHMIDNRNDYYYWVGKLADGHCWMLENLQLDGASVIAKNGSSYVLDSSNTNLPSGETLTPSSTAATGVALGTLPSAATSGDSNYDKLDITNPGSNDPSTYHAANSSINNSNTADYGYLYNWCAAMGGQPTACTDQNTLPTIVSGDICPKDWKIPGGSNIHTGDTYDFDRIAKFYSYGGSWLISAKSPFRGIYSGGFDSSIYGRGEAGYTWSSSLFDSDGITDSAMALEIDSPETIMDTVTTDLNVKDRYYGYAVRCVL